MAELALVMGATMRIFGARFFGTFWKRTRDVKNRGRFALCAHGPDRASLNRPYQRARVFVYRRPRGIIYAALTS